MLASSRTPLTAAARSYTRRPLPATSIRHLTFRVATPRANSAAWWTAAALGSGAALGYTLCQLKPELLPTGESLSFASLPAQG